MNNPETIKTFYELLEHKKQTELREFELSPDFKVSKCVGHFFVSSSEEFIKKVQEHNGKYNLYAGLNERSDKGTEAKEVISVKNIFIDIDCKNKPASEEDLKEAKRITEEIVTFIQSETGKRATIIYSGNGYQLLCKIPEIEITDSNREEVQAKIQQFTKDLINKYHSNKVKLDNVGDLPRIIRITGTTNIKGNKISEFVEIHTEENHKLKDYILNLKLDTLSNLRTQDKITDIDLSKRFNQILETDIKVKKLYEGDFEGYDKSIAGELALCCYLIQYGFNKEEIFFIMASGKIGRWSEKGLGYRNETYRKALAKITQEKEVKEVIVKEEPIKQENPFKKLHYSTQHLPFFHEFSNLAGLYGRHYIPILKARYYQLLGGIIQMKIEMGRVETDTRMHICYPLVTEGGKNELIYSIKQLIKFGIEKKNGEKFSFSQPTSFHPESLIGKFIEVNERILNESTGKYKTIKTRKENKGHLNNDFLDFDECTSLITSKSPESTQAREILSISENAIGKNEVEKRLTEDTPENVVRYYPNCTNSYYFQPFKAIPEEAFLQGFLRRKIIPVGNVSQFLNYASEEIYNYKIQPLDFSKETYKENLINFLERVKQSSYKIIFDNEAQDLIKQYALYLSAQAQIHSEKLANFSKVSKFTTLDYLTKMSAIVSCCYFNSIVTKEAVCLAYMDLVELMQNTYDFIYERTEGDFSYGTSWGGCKGYQKPLLRYLHLQEAYSEEGSKVSIKEFIEEIMNLTKLKSQSQARNKYLDLKKQGLILSKQVGKNESKVWLSFNPKGYEEQIQGDKGSKGYATYNYVFEHQNTILSQLKPLKPLLPLNDSMSKTNKGSNNQTKTLEGDNSNG